MAYMYRIAACVRTSPKPPQHYEHHYMPLPADRHGAGHDGLPVCGVHAVHHGVRHGGAREAGPALPRRPQSRKGGTGVARQIQIGS